MLLLLSIYLLAITFSASNGDHVTRSRLKIARGDTPIGTQNNLLYDHHASSFYLSDPLVTRSVFVSGAFLETIDASKKQPAACAKACLSHLLDNRKCVPCLARSSDLKKSLSSTLKWRAATPNDIDEIYDMVSYALADYNLTIDVTDPDWHEIGRDYLVFDVLTNEDNEIVGTMGLYPLNKYVCELRKMYLRKDYRNGIWGWRMIKRVIKKATECGCRRIVLEMNAAFTTAERLYRAAGFRTYTPVGRLKVGSDCALYLDLLPQNSRENTGKEIVLAEDF